MKKRSNSSSAFPHPIYLSTVLKSNFQHSVTRFFEPLVEINQAHAIMLAHSGIIAQRHAATLLKALGQIGKERKKLECYSFTGLEEDLFFYVERRLANLCGADLSGHLSVARSRNDVDITLYRMVLRKELLQTASQVHRLQRVLLDLAQSHVRSVFPVVTHTQFAQPTTLGHYLMATVEFLHRDLARLMESYHTVNQCPLGACVATTTGFSIDRSLLGRLLGFDTILENAYGCIASVDYLLESVGTVSTLMVSLGRFVQDLLLWSSQESGLLILPDGFVQGSSIMPQKRNPVALEHLRILASNAVGQCQAVVLGLHNTPFGDIVDAEDDIQPTVRAVFEYSERVLELSKAVLEAAEFNVGKALSKCRSGEITLTELADWLVRNRRLPFRTAHRIVSQVGKSLRARPARRRGEPQSQRISTLLQVASQTVAGTAILVAPDLMSSILDPVQFVEARKVFGGPSPRTVERSIARRRTLISRQERWLQEKKGVLDTYARQLNRLS
jgi:argininosuccinate lyase